MTISYKNITIQNAQAADAPLLANWWNDGSVMAHAGFPLGIGTTPERISEDLSKDSDDTRRRLLLRCNDIPVGEMVYRNLGNATADIGIKICLSEFQEKGIGRIALSMLIRVLFQMGYQKIVLDTNLKNLRAQHVYEKLGFQKLCINYDSWTNQLGQSESSVDYELSPENFVNFAV